MPRGPVPVTLRYLPTASVTRYAATGSVLPYRNVPPRTGPGVPPATADQPVGTVIGQNPAAGSTAKLNGRVNITVSAGPEPAPVEPEAPSGSDWWGSLWGGDSSSSSGSSSSTETGESASSSEGSGLADWWASLLG